MRHGVGGPIHIVPENEGAAGIHPALGGGLPSARAGDGKPTDWARWVGFDGSVGPWSRPCRLGRVSALPRARNSVRDDVEPSTHEYRLAA